MRRVGLALVPLVVVGAAAAATFTVAQRDGRDWFVTPEGTLFFSNGVNVVDESGAAERLRGWGFNTLGAWSDAFIASSGMPFTVELHLGSAQGFPWCDFFSENFERAIREAAKKETEKYRGNPRLIGYFTDNELGWWGPAIFRYHLQQPKESATRRELFRVLRDYYGQDFGKLAKDFTVQGARDWKELEGSPSARLRLRAGTGGIHAVSRFTAAAAERYYDSVTRALRAGDPHHLALGDRYAGYFDAAVARAAGRALDVVSTNYGSEFLDGSLTHFFLDALHRVAGKPLLVTEYYFTAMENRSGNKNPGAVFPVVNTQKERAESFARNLSLLAAHPYVIGAHWFQYRDEPEGGRPGDGEDYNMGLVDTKGQPYDLLTKAAADLDTERIHRVGPAADKRSSRVEMRVEMRVKMKDWRDVLRASREQDFVPPLEPEAPADLYVHETDRELWIGAIFMDYADRDLYGDEAEFTKDGPELTLSYRAGVDQSTAKVKYSGTGRVEVSDSSVQAVFEQKATRFRFLAKMAKPVSLDVTLRGWAGAWEARWRWTPR